MKKSNAKKFFILIFCVIGILPLHAAGNVSLDEAISNAVVFTEVHVEKGNSVAVVGIAVTDIESRFSQYSIFLTDELRSGFSESKELELVARGKDLELVVAEQNQQLNMQKQGVLDDSTAINFGRLHGASVVVTGSFERYAGFSQLRIRVISVESRKVSMYGARIDNNDEILVGMSKLLENEELPAIKENALTAINGTKNSLAKGDYGKAIKKGEKAVALDPNVSESYFHLGNSHAGIGAMNEAITDYTAAVEIDPNNAPAYNNLGVVYGEIGETDKAEKSFTVAQKLDPGNSLYKNNKGALKQENVPAGLEFKEESNGTVTITKYHGNEKSINIPVRINGKPVTGIDDRAFSYKGLTRITLPKGLTTIGSSAFSGNQLAAVTIPNSVTTIGYNSFYDNQLTSVTIPDSVTTIGGDAFQSNQLTSVTIPNSVTEIGSRAFGDNKKLAAIIVDSQNQRYTSIDGVLFSKDKKTIHTLPAGKGLTDYAIPNGVTTIASYAFSGNQLTGVTIPNSVTSIGSYAFSGNQLTSVTIPNSITTIGSSAFYNNQLTSVTIPASVTDIGVSAFGGNKELTAIIVDSQNQKYSSIDGVLFSKDRKTIYTLPAGRGPTDYVIPNDVTTIGSNAFSGNQLTAVTIPDSVISIGYQAFSGNQLTAVMIPNSVTSIEFSAFASNQLTAIAIPNSVKTISSWAFQSNKLTAITIPNSVTTIEQGAFSSNQLTSVTIPSNVTIDNNNAFGNDFVPLYNANGKKAGTYTWDGTAWTYIANNGQETVLGGLEQLDSAEWSWYDYYSVTITKYKGDAKTVSIPAQHKGKPVTKIDEEAFKDKQLSGITIPNSITEIAYGAFSGNKLVGVVIPASVTTIGSRAFANNQLTRITIPNSITEIRNEVFSDNQLTSVIIPDSVTKIESLAFANNQLTSITIPSSVSDIGYGVFLGNKGLESIVVDSKNKSYISVDGILFDKGKTLLHTVPEGKKLAEYTIPRGVTKIGAYAFSNNQLSAVTIANTVTEIGEYAFANNQLTSVTIPRSVTVIHSGAFAGNNITSITIQASVAEIEEDAFDGDFNSCYEENGKKAGVYTLTGETWAYRNN